MATRAQTRLCNIRLALEEHLQSNRYRDYRGRIRLSTHLRIRQLSPLSDTGALGPIPSARPGGFDTPERIESDRQRNKLGATPLRSVECVLTDDEMEVQWGLLPGEVQDEEEDLDADMEIMEWQTLEGRMMEDLMDGEEAEGVWKNVDLKDGMVEGEVFRMMVDETKRLGHLGLEEGESAVMDGRSREIVQSARRMVEGLEG